MVCDEHIPGESMAEAEDGDEYMVDEIMVEARELVAEKFIIPP